MGQGRELGAGLDLEDADGVGAAQHRVDLLVLVVDERPVDALSGVPGDEVDHLVEGGEHAQAEEVELDEVHRRAVVLVPLDDGAVVHRRVLDGHDLPDGTVGEDHPNRVDAEVAG